MTTVQSLAGGVAAIIFFSVLLGSIFAWSNWIARCLNGTLAKGLIVEPQATVGLIDILVTILVLISLFFIAAVILSPTSPIAANSSTMSRAANLSTDEISAIPAKSDIAAKSTQRSMTQLDFRFSSLMSTAQLVCLVLVSVFICARTGCSPKKLGWRLDQVLGDLASGFRCFLMMTPPILIMSAILQQLTHVKYDHPVIEMIEKYPWLLGFAFWQAAIVAPISEEFAFRGLMLGWFESIHFANDKLHAIMFGLRIRERNPIDCAANRLSVSESNQTHSIAPDMVVAETVSPYTPPFQMEHERNYQGLVLESPTIPPWWPAIISGLLFGLAHFTYGVSWIPLIVFGVVLGRLYQIRQSLLPVIVVHVLFNSMTLIMLGLSVLLPNTLQK